MRSAASPHAPDLSLSIVIPAYNEERRLASSLERVTAYLRAQFWQWEVRVVDDGSRDGTAAVAEIFSRSEPRVVVQREPHVGKGAAVKAGLLASTAAYRFICDADLSMPPHELSRFLPPVLTDFDVAIGTREGHAARRIGEPLYRHLMGRLFNQLVQRLVVPGIEDTQCGFKMFTARAVETIFPRVTIGGWAFDIEALAIARQHGLRIREVPIEWRFDQDSRVSMVRDSIAMMRDVFRVRAKTRGPAVHNPHRGS